MPVVIWVRIMSALDHTGQSRVQTVPACPIQIRAHHHIDVYTDINNATVTYFQKFMGIFIKSICSLPL